jgi:hypothetical protein
MWTAIAIWVAVSAAIFNFGRAVQRHRIAADRLEEEQSISRAQAQHERLARIYANERDLERQLAHLRKRDERQAIESVANVGSAGWQGAQQQAANAYADLFWHSPWRKSR